MTLAAQVGTVSRTISPPATFSNVEATVGASSWRTIGGSVTLRYIGRTDEASGIIDYAEGIANYASEPL